MRSIPKKGHVHYMHVAKEAGARKKVHTPTLIRVFLFGKLLSFCARFSP